MNNPQFNFMPVRAGWGGGAGAAGASVSWLFLVACLSACTPTYPDSATLVASVDPLTVFAKLSEASSLDKGAGQFAAAIYVDLQAVRVRIQPGTWAVSSPKCKKCSMMLLKVERIRCKQLSGALEAERFARPSV